MKRIFEFRWKDENSHYFSGLENNELKEIPIKINENISIELVSDVACTGYYLDGWNNCINGGVRGVRKCQSCKTKEGMPIAQYCDGYNTNMFSGEEIESLNTPHYVYFALFDKDLVKVGVSSMSRGFLRQLEQGSHFSLIIAEDIGGILARKIETTIKKTGMLDKIQSSQKKDLFFVDIKEKEAKKILMNIYETKIPSLFAVQSDFKNFIKKEPELKYFDNFYNLEQAEAINKPINNIDLEVGESVSGKTIAIKGPMMMIETDDERCIINAKKLKGFEIDFSEKATGLNLNSGFQSALF